MLGRVKNNHWFFWFKIDYNYSVAVCRHGGSELWESSRYKAISSKSTERGGALCSLDILMDERRYQTGAKRPLEEGFPSSSRRGRDATINGKQFRNCGVVGRNVRSRERPSIVLERPGRHGLLGSLLQWGVAFVYESSGFYVPRSTSPSAGISGIGDDGHSKWWPLFVVCGCSGHASQCCCQKPSITRAFRFKLLRWAA